MNYPSTRKSLLEKVRSGDEVSWTEFYRRYAPVIRYAGTLCHFNADECDDLVQNVMLKFFNSAKRFVYRENEVKFRTYFATVIRSQAVDFIRKNRRAEAVLPAEEAIDPAEDGEFMDRWRHMVLEDALEELRRRVDASTYQAFEMYALQHRKAAEVSAVLGVSKAQLYLAKSRCLRMLREIVGRCNEFDGELHLEL
ncbi:MAG: sigma-70 family RNA polymerase sigma factor [Lentisphaeria bacterium]|nr:sigma-70 family RNA polymerase sigma factor [Lentisphaeria bacterium]